MTAISTTYQPSKRKTNATNLHHQGLAPSQIDFIIASKRWSSGFRKCSVQWKVAINKYGSKYDHGLIKAKFKGRLMKNRKGIRRNLKTIERI